ncbi:cytochrome P450 [Aspergillus unguis]
MIPLSSITGVFLYLLFPAIFFYINAIFSVPNPKGVRLVREPVGKSTFSWRTRLAYLTDCKSLFREAYTKYLKHGQAVVLPGFGLRNELMLPSSSLKWALAQPDRVLSVSEAFCEIDQPLYSLGHMQPILDPWQGNLVRNDINAVLENIVAALNDELAVAFDTHFGTDTDSWKEIDLMETVRTVVAQAATRFTVGVPLCRNDQYLKDCFDAIDGCVINAGVVGGTPPFLRPLVGPLAGLKARLATKRVRQHFEPLYRERLETLKYAKDDPGHVEPQDHLQMMLRYAQKERPHELYDLDNITARLIGANFGSMHQTTMQVVNMLLDILGSDTEYNTIAILRDEVSRILGTGTEWTKAKVSKMTKADSVARETLRCHAFGSRAVLRKVMADGVTTDAGVNLPKGSLVSFLSHGIHSDESIYEDPFKYDPFRFSRIREADTESKTGSMSFVSTGSSFLPFGHGKHACPGRFLVDFELKMIIAYVLTKYDVKFPVEYGGERPPNRWMAEVIAPPAGVKVLVKRRI